MALSRHTLYCSNHAPKPALRGHSPQLHIDDISMYYELCIAVALGLKSNVN